MNWRSATSRLLTVLLLGTWATSASAVQYESEIEIETEQDLYDLQLEGEISETTLETLLELLRSGVDLNTADAEELYELPNLTYAEVRAILNYRKQSGRIDAPEDLVAANAISAKQLVQLAPFLVLSDASPGDVPFSGRADMGLGYSNADSGAPPAYLRARVKGPFSLTAGLLGITTRRMLGDVSWDAERDRLIAETPSYSFHLPKLYVQWKKTNYSVIVGSFRLGFAERLTLDNTTRNTPDGFYADDVVFVGQDLERRCKLSAGDVDGPCSDEDNASYVTPDFTWRDGFRGAAARVDAPLGDLRLKATIFGSYQSRSIYQYEIFNHDDDTCDDPHGESDKCKAPPIYQSSEQAAKYSYLTLPDIYDELAGGGNLTLKIGPHGQVGFTGYFARPSWNVTNPNDPEFQLDFQEWSRTPYGGPFGAIGLNGAVTLGTVNFFLEAARSFDSMKYDRNGDGSTEEAGGGFGVLQRTTFSALAQEFELSLRYYDRDFANPYSRATSAPDEFEGQRGRNEAGVRLRYRGVTGDWVLSGDTDFWFWPEDAKLPGTAGTRHLSAKGQVKFAGYELIQPFVSLEYKNKDLDNNADADDAGEGACYELGEEDDPDGNARPCSGSFYRAAVGVKVKPMRDLSFDLRYQHELLNDPKNWERYQEELLIDPKKEKVLGGLRQDAVLHATIAYKPIDSVWIRLRLRYLNEALAMNDYLEDSLWSYLQVTYVVNKQLRVSARYDLYAYIDERESTVKREVYGYSPEQRGRIELEAKF